MIVTWQVTRKTYNTYKSTAFKRKKQCHYKKIALIIKNEINIDNKRKKNTNQHKNHTKLFPLFLLWRRRSSGHMTSFVPDPSRQLQMQLQEYLITFRFGGRSELVFHTLYIGRNCFGQSQKICYILCSLARRF